MADEAPKPVAFGDTQAIRWARKKFSGPALAVIGSLALSFGGYVWSVKQDLHALEVRIDRLNDRMPSGDNGVSNLRDELSHVRENAGVMEQRIESQDRALQRIYERFNFDYIDSMAPLSKRKRK